MLTAQQILSSKKCGDLFSSADKQVVIAEYREIARAYHPDIPSDVAEKYPEIKYFYDIVETLLLSDAGYETTTGERCTTKEELDSCILDYESCGEIDTIEKIISEGWFSKELYDECINLIEDGYTILFKDIGYDDEALHSMLKEIGDKGIGVKILDSD